MPETATVEDLIDTLTSLKTSGERKLIAIAGPPAAGKSSVTQILQDRFGDELAMLPMDGFHLDDRILIPAGMRERKGAPDTFDAAGFIHMVKRVKAGETVYAPEFDRNLELSRAAAIEISDQLLVVAEGNYLLLDQKPWNSLFPQWDLTVWLDVPYETLVDRSTKRWLGHGFDLEYAKNRAEGNDLANARFVVENSIDADLTIQQV